MSVRGGARALGQRLELSSRRFVVFLSPAAAASAAGTACLSLLFALAISRTLQDFVDKDEVMIKWPNDVLIKDKKK